MSLIKVEIKEVISKSNNLTRFKGGYHGGHSTFSPRGFEAVVEGYEGNFNEGTIYNYDPKTTTILNFGDGHEEIMKDFSDNIEQIIKNKK